MPERFAGVRPTIAAFHQALGDGLGEVLVTLREQVVRHLHALPVPLGLRPWGPGGSAPGWCGPHETGPALGGDLDDRRSTPLGKPRAQGDIDHADLAP